MKKGEVVNEIQQAFLNADIFESIAVLFFIAGAWEGLKILCEEIGRSVGWK
jgi:hypothetical protein